jgi:hypothetical protein
VHLDVLLLNLGDDLLKLAARPAAAASRYLPAWLDLVRW